MFAKIGSIFTDALFPRRCPVCHEIAAPRGNLICPPCVRRLHFIKAPYCVKCGKEIVGETGEYCYDCGGRRRSFESGRALIAYTDVARDSMIHIKYKNKREYLDFYTEAIAARFGTVLSSIHGGVLIPVPVHPSRLRERGYNQAGLLAAGLGSKLGIPVDQNTLQRRKKTAPQKGLSPRERLKNLEQAFFAAPSAAYFSSVILVDDIYTTGSTIEACARALKRAGVGKVYFITICIGGKR